MKEGAQDSERLVYLSYRACALVRSADVLLDRYGGGEVTAFRNGLGMLIKPGWEIGRGVRQAVEKRYLFDWLCLLRLNQIEYREKISRNDT